MLNSVYRIWIPAGIVLGVLWGGSSEAASLSLYSSVSMRSPKDRPNPFDYELALGFEYAGAIIGMLDIQRERDNGRMYTDQEYKACYPRRWFEAEVRYYDGQEEGLFIHSYSLALKPLVWVGVGLTRQYARRTFGQGAWMGHLSVESTRKIGIVSLMTMFVYESNLDRRRIVGKLEVGGFHLGRIQIVPFGVYEGLTLQGNRTLDRYQAKIRFQIDIGGQDG